MEVRLLWEILRDRYKALSLVTAGFVFFAVLLLILAPTIYESTAHIMVKKADEYTSFVKELPQSFGTLSYIDTDNLLGSIDLFLRNEVLVSQVMRKCNLHDVVSFPPNKFSDPGLISILFRKRGVGIESEKDTEVFSIKGLSPDIKEAQKIANTFLEQFLQYYAEQKRKEIEKAKSSYVQKAAEMRTALLKIEQEELEYRTKRNVIDFDLQKQKLIDRLKELNASRDELKTDLASLTESYNELKEVIARNSEYHKVSESISKNDLIQYYKQEIAQQEGQLEAKKLELTAEHPEIRTIEKKIAALRNLMNKEKEKIFSSTLMSRNTYYDTLIQKREDHSIEVIKLQGGIEANENQAQAVTEQLK
ncbi:MAG: Wzz/FepE/Etk N-terminal domain-containing protein, partial [Desulforhabdus sp.]|nr:Wzz/FepE/Etk N-terminal domain-containing protein [Desulforhabdus sp.]